MDKAFLRAIVYPLAIWLVVIIAHVVQGNAIAAITLAMCLVSAMGLTAWGYYAGRESVRNEPPASLAPAQPKSVNQRGLPTGGQGRTSG